jgi:hypothetical protein
MIDFLNELEASNIVVFNREEDNMSSVFYFIDDSKLILIV